jgi:hypothetical protein
VSIASLPGMYARTIPLYTFSKSYAMTGLRLAYVAVHDRVMRDRIRKMLFYTVSNSSSLIQYGGLGALTGSQDSIEAFRVELAARRDLFYAGIRDAAHGLLTGEPPTGEFYAFLKIDPAWRSPLPDAPASLSWAMAEFLITRGRIGCIPGVDFGAASGVLTFPPGATSALIHIPLVAGTGPERTIVFGLPDGRADGLQSRDFTYVANVVEANLLACEAANAAGDFYNVACGERYSLLDLLSTISEITGIPAEAQHEPARAGDVKHSLADISKIHRAMHFEPRVNFREGLEKTVAHFAQVLA